MDKTSPQASTEKGSLHINFGLNKLNLEKSLRNRPNQNVLVNRGILVNPGKAHPGTMQELDLAKKRDKLKNKIKNRPDREELLRKSILHEETDDGKDKFNKIKELLDSTINTRPGSLELVDKNILQIDRFLASRIHSGDITFPKVCRDEVYFESNSKLHLPSISEDTQSSHSDLSDILSQSSSVKSSKISYKKTCRVGRFSFHNIEFRPTPPQKAREFQQIELLEYEKIQAQHDPSLKRVHSELTMKSRKIKDCKYEKYRPSKYSMLHRLNIHELKSECKIRMIPCSNIPKALLVEKLLPYETEVLQSHLSFDQNRNAYINKGDRRSASIISCPSDLSPPDLSTELNLTPPPHSTFMDQQRTPSNYSGTHTLSKISHSFSEPLIAYSNNLSLSMSPVQFTFPNNSTTIYSNFPTTVDSNSSHPLLYDNFSYSRQSCGSLDPPKYSQPSVESDTDLIFHSQPSNYSGFESNVDEPSCSSSLTQPISLPSYFSNSVSSPEESSHTFPINKPPVLDTQCDQTYSYIPLDVTIPLVPNDCSEKFSLINNQLVLLKIIIGKINQIKTQFPNHIIHNSIFDEYNSAQTSLVNLCTGMIDFINMEQKYRHIDQTTAVNQRNWLKELLQSINRGFSDIDYNHNPDKRLLIFPTNGLTVSNDGNAMLCRNNGLDDLDIDDFLNVESNKTPNQLMNDALFLKSENMDNSWDHKDRSTNDLKTPETPFSEMCHSPMSTGDLDHIMSSLLNSSDDPYP